MKKLKVLYDFGPAYRKDKTGIPVFVEHICTELATHENIDLVVTADISKLFPVHFKPLFRFVEKILYYDLYIPIKLTIGRYDIYVESQYMHIPLFKAPKTKVITFVYDIGLAMFDDIQTQQHLRNWRTKFPISVKNSNTLVTISKSSLLDIQDYLVKIGVQNKRVEYIYANAGTLGSVESKAPQGDFQHCDSYFLYLGTLEPRKNPMRIIRAFKDFKLATKSPIKMVFSGKKGWLYQDIFEFVKAHDLQNEVIFTGFVSNEEKLYLLSNATAFIFMSVYEGFGIPPLEALKLGVPTLVSDIPVFRELFEESVLYADPMNHEDIATSMSKILLEQPNIAHSILDKFDWNRSAAKLVCIMKQTAYEESI